MSPKRPHMTGSYAADCGLRICILAPDPNGIGKEKIGEGLITTDGSVWRDAPRPTSEHRRLSDLLGRSSLPQLAVRVRRAGPLEARSELLSRSAPGRSPARSRRRSCGSRSAPGGCG